MDIKVKFYATLRDIAGTSHDTVDSGGNTIGDVMEALVIKHGAKFKEEIFHPDGSIRQNVKVFLNGVAIDRIAPLQTVVREGDTLFIFPPIVAG